jgi:hypothetical protein
MVHFFFHRLRGQEPTEEELENFIQFITVSEMLISTRNSNNIGNKVTVLAYLFEILLFANIVSVKNIRNCCSQHSASGWA